MKKYSLILAFAILIIGICASILVQLVRNKVVLNTKTNEVNQLVENKKFAIEHELSASFSSVEILRYFFEKDIGVSRNEFQNYTTPIYMENKAIKAISWVPKITHNERLKFESDIKNVLHIQNFSITERDSKNKLKPAAPNEFYFPVKFIEPLADNFGALGYDIYSDKVRNATIDESINKQKFVITPPIILVQDTLGYSFLGIIPVFYNNTSSKTNNEIHNVKGLISTVFKVNQLINNALFQSKITNINLVINDITDKQKEKIFDNIGFLKKNYSIQKKQIHVAGRTWELEFVINPSLYKIDNKYSYFLVGISITFILFLLLLLPQIKTKRSRILSEQLEAEQNRREKTEYSLIESENLNKTLVNQLPQNIFIKDTASVYIICNESYANNLNISPKDIIGKTDFEFFPVELAEKYRSDDREVIEKGEIIDIEEKIVLYGKESIIHTTKVPYRDSDNKVIGIIGIFEDITERKEAEEKSKYHELLLKEMGQAAKIGGWDFDTETGKGTWTDEVARIHDLDPNDETNVEIGMSFYKEENRLLIENAIKEAIESGKSYNLELEMVTKKNNHKWVQTIGHPTIENGKVIRVRGSFQDITERKLAEEEIKKANRVYAVLSNINHAIVHVQDKITLYNEVCRIAVQDGKFVMAWIGIVDENSTKVIPVASNGFTDDYLENINIDLTDSKLSHGPTGQTVQSGIHTIANDIANNPEMIPWRDNALKLGYKSSASFPIVVFGKTIGAFMIYASESYFFNDVELKLFDEISANISFAVEFIENEMKRKQDELEIYRLNNHLQNLIEVIQNLTLARSMDEIINSVMSVARNLTEADGVTFVLRDEDQCSYVNEDSIKPLWKGQKFPLEKCISGWTMLHRELVIIEDIYKDARIPHEAYRPTFVKSLAMIPIRTKNPVGAIGVYWATNHRPTNEQIVVIQTLADATAIAMENLTFYNELDAKVKERTILLEATNKELEAFSYSVSHDLRAPLRHITGYIDLLNRRFPDALPENGKHYLENISKSAIQMGILIDDLLQLSRTGRQEIQMEKLNMNLLIQDVIKVINFENKERNIEWNVSTVPDVWGDTNLLKLVWINLLSNAAKFTRNKELAKIEIGYYTENK
ncbi:MAG: CHASE domain-containing protein, partial [Paludibacter sp.]